MTILHLLRSSGTGHSIETVFSDVRWGPFINKNFTVEPVTMPCISRDWQSVWRNLRFARQQQADVFHITGDVHYLALALPKSRTVLTIHDAIPLVRNRHRPLRYALFWLLWYYWPMRRASIVTTVSEKSRQELLQRVGRVARKVVVVANPVGSLFQYCPQPVNTRCPTLLHIGTAPHKNLTRLIQALDGFACRLIIVGPLTDSDKAELNHRRIVYENYVDLPQHQLLNLYKTCDLVSFVSTYEGFGLPILEAQAVGRPVLTSAISPLREVAGMGAHFVDPTNIQDIRAGLERICGDVAYRETLVANGLVNVKKFTISQIERYYAALYASMGISDP
ncbi:glycosyltransferase family 4 protein [Spirosoma montaniterrae]|uniref:Group 1 glycosyl transferase n=1 Tax=Spirosoma montaniterrae TaxID=1178516 RepID=A0A1P9WYX3_9BACT|nr:glycosyltransferase family 1 protein [Spirosoma montaniterrae]AQG80572.1 group 1 glycosyl transferase [Spirosoma montaniterrae]